MPLLTGSSFYKNNKLRHKKPYKRKSHNLTKSFKPFKETINKKKKYFFNLKKKE